MKLPGVIFRFSLFRAGVLHFRAFVALMGLCLLVFLAVGFFWLVYNPVPTTFDVKAQTEILYFQTQKPATSRWVLADAVIDRGSDFELFDGEFEPGRAVKVRVERIGHGSLWMYVTALEGKSVGIFYQKDRPVGRAGKVLSIRFKDLKEKAEKGETLLITLGGQVRAGELIGSRTGGGNALLRSGKVRLYGKSLVSDKPFGAGVFPLETGDLFTIDGQRGEASGFFLVNEQPGIQAVYRAIGESGRLQLPGGGVRKLEAVYMKRFLYDPFYQALSWGFAILVAVTSLGGFFISVRQELRGGGGDEKL